MTAEDSSPTNPPIRRRSRPSSPAPAFLATPAPNQNALTEERRRLDEDIAELRQTEANLQAYEKRLRALQTDIEAAGRQRSATRAPVRLKSKTKPPFAGDADELKEEWNKLIRARELLEIEQAHVRGDRLALSDETAVVRRRAQAVAEREAQMAEREQMMQMAEVGAQAAPPPTEVGPDSSKTPHLLAKMTMAPFAMTRSLLRRSATDS
ncbi:MAG: hypothetical protein H7343_19300 [Undibacterium sp.]|nr:hypothetical protein [Opitutaceae bacterium]